MNANHISPAGCCLEEAGTLEGKFQLKFKRGIFYRSENKIITSWHYTTDTIFDMLCYISISTFNNLSLSRFISFTQTIRRKSFAQAISRIRVVCIHGGL